ncbi:NAD(P)H-dependent glycerol-3-phosphate dehydrogenase [Alkalilacustris brevis]|uniref:NAD(P)H-dependent glycerol-3-phosphate dehydrogenase n=1 Tax=Alkalilacustris brevis TaxID=2026338 RepID=UPI000E0DCE86|nr:NAD(P)H-dependent glycerol-3-phosphate dehydrogenase [Alkalilacustris brevis]
MSSTSQGGLRVAVAGAGAFGTALAVVLAHGGARVTLWARDADHVAEMRRLRENTRRLPGVTLPDVVELESDPALMVGAEAVLLAVPMQRLSGFLRAHVRVLGRVGALVACSKGIDLETGLGPVGTIAAVLPGSRAAILTGPSFAADIARGLPTALTLACADEATAGQLQARLSTPALRLYRSTDVAGAELGGALKNVIAIAAGIVIGAGLGDSARAALTTRGYAEMLRLAEALGARSETLAGLSGIGDLVLTCTSEKSRNFRFGKALAAGEQLPEGTTVEGAATARAVLRLAERHAVELPICAMIAAILEDRLSIAQAVEALLARPLKEE